MGSGQATEIAVQRKDAIALVAVLRGEGELSADYQVILGITADERRGVAEKLREIAKTVETS